MIQMEEFSNQVTKSIFAIKQITVKRKLAAVAVRKSQEKKTATLVD